MVTAAMLSLPDGSILVVTDMAASDGIVALALFASNLAGERNRGAIQMLCETEPNRLMVLASKVLALTTVIAATIAVLTRSTAIAVCVGLVWFTLAAALIGSFWNGPSRWGPAAASSALAAGSTGASGRMGSATPGIRYATAILIALGYRLLAFTIRDCPGVGETWRTRAARTPLPTRPTVTYRASPE